MKNFETDVTRRGRYTLAVALFCLVLFSISIARAAEDAFSASVLAQIQALETEKQNRTPAQLKLDSQLVYAIKMQRGDPVASGINSQQLYFTWDEIGRAHV